MKPGKRLSVFIMKRVFITGSSDGLGFLAGKILVEQGHHVLFHARNNSRADAIQKKIPGAEGILSGDVSTLAGIRSLADQLCEAGSFDAVIHNVGVGMSESGSLTGDGVTGLFAVNVLAPYLLTALVPRPGRLIYLSSGMHLSGSSKMDDLQWQSRSWNSSQAYSDTKLLDQILAMWLARNWKDTLVNTVDPGWVPTRMGGSSAPDDLFKGAETQAWLAVSEEEPAKVSGRYFHHKKQRKMHPDAENPEIQDRLVDSLQELTGVRLPV